MSAQTHLIIDLGVVFAAFVTVLFFFVIRPMGKTRKHMEIYASIYKLIATAKTAEDFEAAYHALKKDNFDMLYLVWCLQFTERLKEIHSQIITEIEEKEKIENPHPMYAFQRIGEMLNFFGSVCRYLTPVEQNILNGITNKLMGMFVLNGPLFF